MGGWGRSKNEGNPRRIFPKRNGENQKKKKPKGRVTFKKTPSGVTGGGRTREGCCRRKRSGKKRKGWGKKKRENAKQIGQNKDRRDTSIKKNTGEEGKKKI